MLTIETHAQSRQKGRRQRAISFLRTTLFQTHIVEVRTLVVIAQNPRKLLVGAITANEEMLVEITANVMNRKQRLCRLRNWPMHHPRQHFLRILPQLALLAIESRLYQIEHKRILLRIILVQCQRIVLLSVLRFERRIYLAQDRLKVILYKLFSGALPWWSSGYDPMFPVQGAWVQSLVGELDPTWCN